MKKRAPSYKNPAEPDERLTDGPTLIEAARYQAGGGSVSVGLHYRIYPSQRMDHERTAIQAILLPTEITGTAVLITGKVSTHTPIYERKKEAI